MKKILILAMISMCLMNTINCEIYKSYRESNDFTIRRQKKIIAELGQSIKENVDTIMQIQVYGGSDNKDQIDFLLSPDTGISKEIAKIKHHLGILRKAEIKQEKMDEKNIPYGVLSKEKYEELMSE